MQAPPEAFALLYFVPEESSEVRAGINVGVAEKLSVLALLLVAERTTKFLLDVVVAHLLVHIRVLRAAVTDVGFAVERLVWIDQALVNHPVFFGGLDYLLKL